MAPRLLAVRCLMRPFPPTTITPPRPPSITSCSDHTTSFERCLFHRPLSPFSPASSPPGPANPIGVLQCSLQLRRPRDSLALGASPVQAASRAFPPVSFLGTGGLNASGCAYVGDLAAVGQGPRGFGAIVPFFVQQHVWHRCTGVQGSSWFADHERARRSTLESGQKGLLAGLTRAPCGQRA